MLTFPQTYDTFNAYRTTMFQVTAGPQAAAAPPAPGPPLNDLLRNLASVNDAALAQQLLSQLKLEQGAADADAKGNLMDSMTGAEAWPTGSASRFPWQDNSGIRQMPPPGLGQDAGDSAMWGRGTGWNAPNEKFKVAAGKLQFLLLEVRSCLCMSFILSYADCLQCFDAVGWAAGRASGL